MVARVEPQRNKDISEEHCKVCLNICQKAKKQWFQMEKDFRKIVCLPFTWSKNWLTESKRRILVRKICVTPDKRLFIFVI